MITPEKLVVVGKSFLFTLSLIVALFIFFNWKELTQE